MDSQYTVYKKEGGIATLTLNRPEKLNVFTSEVAQGIVNAVEDASKDDNVRVLVITGTGRAFCAGADVKAMAANAVRRAKEKKEVELVPQRKYFPIGFQNCQKPIIAAVNGLAVGLGLELTLSCDIRIASDKARFAMAHVRRGMIAAAGGIYFLPRLVGIDQAFRLIYTGDMIDATEAVRIGLVTMVVPHDELENTTMELADKIAKGARLAIQGAKRALYAGLGTDLNTSLEYTLAIRDELMKSEDHREGTISFVEKRAPVFKGK